MISSQTRFTFYLFILACLSCALRMASIALEILILLISLVGFLWACVGSWYDGCLRSTEPLPLLRSLLDSCPPKREAILGFDVSPIV